MPGINPISFGRDNSINITVELMKRIQANQAQPQENQGPQETNNTQNQVRNQQINRNDQTRAQNTTQRPNPNERPQNSPNTNDQLIQALRERGIGRNIDILAG